MILKKGKTRTILLHLTRAGQVRIAHKAHARLFVTTRTPAVKGIRAARVWSTTIAFHA